MRNVHFFFVGKMASGNLYLFMCKCLASGVPSIWGFDKLGQVGVRGRGAEGPGVKARQTPGLGESRGVLCGSPCLVEPLPHGVRG